MHADRKFGIGRSNLDIVLVTFLIASIVKSCYVENIRLLPILIPFVVTRNELRCYHEKLPEVIIR